MSLAALCPACEWGNHEHHNRDWGIRPGLIGGAACYCTGDCKEKADKRALDFAKRYDFGGAS